MVHKKGVLETQTKYELNWIIYMNMKVNNMKELLKYVEEKKRKQAHSHYEVAKLHGSCSGMGNKKYKVQQKSTFRKGKSFAYKGRWAYYSVNPTGHYKLNTN